MTSRKLTRQLPVEPPTGGLPEFEDPPVNETVLSIQFSPLKGFTVAHFGLYWSGIRSRFPKVQVQPSLPSVIEKFDAPLQGGPRLGFQLVMQPEVRCWFLNEAETGLIQLQTDRFINNWKKVSGKEVYPRYPSIRQTLSNEWTGFCRFLDQNGIDSPQVNQCEVTYVNHIEYKKGWQDYGELNKVLEFWSGKTSDGFLPSPERSSMNVHYCLPGNAGRLHVSIDPVIRTRDGNEVLQINLTARGAPSDSTAEQVLKWMDLGREWVVKGFTDLTSKHMHRIWGRKK